MPMEISNPCPGHFLLNLNREFQSYYLTKKSSISPILYISVNKISLK
jgi:hypothetical protein